jgi:hypothetical protein
MTELFPITLKTARGFVCEYHRHNAPPQGHKFSIGLKSDGKLIGVVICGRPIARTHDDGYTAEITRCCVLDNQLNANSKLYAAALRAAKAMGYRRAITYTLPAESGASLKAVGFTVDGETQSSPNGWNVPSRPRNTPDKYPVGRKTRWVKEL